MKIREVCALTGLTERTIRYYEEEKLISPSITRSNGRSYRDYSSEDTAQLKIISGLRRVGLSIEEIRKMQRRPQKIADVMNSYRERLAAEVSERSALLESIKDIDFDNIKSLNVLEACLSDAAPGRPLPKCDAEPNFSRFDPEPPEDKEREFELYKQRKERLYNQGQIIIIVIAAVNVVQTIAAQFIAGFSLFTLIFQIILSACLLMGSPRARWIFVSGAAACAVIMFFVIVMSVSELSIGYIILFIVIMAYYIASCILLFVHKGVSEFLYEQQNG